MFHYLSNFKVGFWDYLYRQFSSVQVKYLLVTFVGPISTKVYYVTTENIIYMLDSINQGGIFGQKGCPRLVGMGLVWQIRVYHLVQAYSVGLIIRTRIFQSILEKRFLCTSRTLQNQNLLDSIANCHATCHWGR